MSRCSLGKKNVRLSGLTEEYSLLKTYMAESSVTAGRWGSMAKAVELVPEPAHRARY